MGSITKIPTSKSNVFGFQVKGEIEKDDLVGMADTMLRTFEHHQSINMLLVFENYEGIQLSAGMNASVLKAQLKGISKIDKYAVVGGPGIADAIVSLSDAVMPVASASFSIDEMDKAWAFVGAEPAHSVPQ